MKLKVLIGILVFLIVVNLATIGTFLFEHFTRKPPAPPLWADFGRGERPSRGMHGEQGEHMHFRNEEREQLITLLEGFREDTQDLRTRARDLERATFELMQADTVPEARVDSLLKEISQIEYEISKKATARLIEAKRILPPEQQRQFFNAIHRSHMRMRGEAGHSRMERGQRRRWQPQRPDSAGDGGPRRPND